MNDPTFQRLAHQAHAGAQGSALDQLERGLVGSALDAVRRDVAHESLDQLTHKLFVSAGQPPPSAAQAQHQMEEKQERFERLGHIPGDGGARHYAAMARYERYIQLKQEEEEAKSKQWLSAVGDAAPTCPPSLLPCLLLSTPPRRLARHPPMLLLPLRFRPSTTSTRPCSSSSRSSCCCCSTTSSNTGCSRTLRRCWLRRPAAASTLVVCLTHTTTPPMPTMRQCHSPA